MRYALALVLYLQGCGGMPAEDWSRWVTSPANGLRQEKLVPPLSIALQYRPSEFAALRERGGDFDRDAFERARSAHADSVEFQLRVGAVDPAADAWSLLGPAVEPVSRELAEHVHLTVDGTPAPPPAALLEATRGLTPYLGFMLEFPVPEPMGKSLVVTVDAGAFGPTDLVFEFPAERLGAIPALRLPR